MEDRTFDFDSHSPPNMTLVRRKAQWQIQELLMGSAIDGRVVWILLRPSMSPSGPLWADDPSTLFKGGFRKGIRAREAAE